MKPFGERLMSWSSKRAHLWKSNLLRRSVREYSIAKNCFVEEEKKRSKTQPVDSNNSKATFFNRVNKLCQNNSFVNYTISDMKNILQEYEDSDRIPDFAMALLIEKTLQEKNFEMTTDLVIQSFLQREVLDILIYETVLQHFIGNKYLPGISLMISLYRAQFKVPTLNWLILVQYAFEKETITEKEYRKCLQDYTPLQVESQQSQLDIENMIRSKKVRVGPKMMQFALSSERGFLFQNNSSKKLEKEELRERKGKEIILFDPEIEGALHATIQSPEILDEGMGLSIENDFNQVELDEHKKKGYSDEDDLRDGISLGYIQMFMKGSGAKNDPLRLNFNYVDASSDSEDYTSEEGDSETSNSEDESNDN